MDGRMEETASIFDDNDKLFNVFDKMHEVNSNLIIIMLTGNIENSIVFRDEVPIPETLHIEAVEKNGTKYHLDWIQR